MKASTKPMAITIRLSQEPPPPPLQKPLPMGRVSPRHPQPPGTAPPAHPTAEESHSQALAGSRAAGRRPVAVRSHPAVGVHSRRDRPAVVLRSRTGGHTGVAHRIPAVGRLLAEDRSRVAVRTGRGSADRRAVARPVGVHLVSDPAAEAVAAPSGDRPEAARPSSGLLVLDE